MCAVAAQSGLGRVKSNLASGVKKGKMSQEAADAVMQRVKGTLDYSDFKSVDMVRPAACVTSTCIQLHATFSQIKLPCALCSAFQPISSTVNFIGSVLPRHPVVLIYISASPRH